MTQPIKVKKSPAQTTSTLWWQPLMEMQRDMSKMIRETVSDTPILAAFMTPDAWEIEKNLVDTMQRNTHRILSEMFNSRQMTTSMMIGALPEPYINIIENSECFKITADLPGLDARDLEITISHCAMTITGKRTDGQREAGNYFLRQEYHGGEFNRTIALPEEAEIDNASISFDQNVLKIDIPKKSDWEKSAPKPRINSVKAPIYKPTADSEQPTAATQE